MEEAVPVSESFESFESAMTIFRENLAGMYDNGHMTKWADVDTSVDLDRLQRAHDHELEQACDPQRIGGTLERGSFEYAIEQLREFRWQHATNDEDAIPYINNVARAHEQTRKAEYARGYEDGRRSKDADHAAVALRLSGLRFDGGSHENLSKIAYAIYPCATGWTCESSKGLRDMLVDLMGGVTSFDLPKPQEIINFDDECSDQIDWNRANPSISIAKAEDKDDTCDSRRGCACGDSRACGVGEPTETITDDVLGNERHKAVCELRKLRERDVKIWNIEISIALGLDLDASNDNVCDRLIYLLGGDAPAMDEGPSDG